MAKSAQPIHGNFYGYTTVILHIAVHVLQLQQGTIVQWCHYCYQPQGFWQPQHTDMKRTLAELLWIIVLTSNMLLLLLDNLAVLHLLELRTDTLRIIVLTSNKLLLI